MYRILYISTARAILSDAELEQLLRTSRRNNAAVGVTGMLVAGGRRFQQVLEGPREAVEATYERIRRDPRHFAATILSRQVVEERLMACWSMAYTPGGDAAARGSLRRAIASLCAPVADPVLRAYFQGFADLHDAA